MEVKLYGPRKRERPRKRWLRDVKDGLMNLGVANWIQVAADRNKLSGIVLKAKAHHEL